MEDQKPVLLSIEPELYGEKQQTPANSLVMRAFELPVPEIKVLLLGQDPYPTHLMACGLAFAVSKGSKQPQSLKNLMRELASDIPTASNSGDLERWSKQGVLLLNSALTTVIGKPAAHQKLWRPFIEAVIRRLDDYLSGSLVCLSLGAEASKLSALIEKGSVIYATHPSPLSANRGFFGSSIYSKVNQELTRLGSKPIDWTC